MSFRQVVRFPWDSCTPLPPLPLLNHNLSFLMRTFPCCCRRPRRCSVLPIVIAAWLPRLFASLLLLLLLAPAAAHAQKIDLNTNNLSDIWELIYNHPGAADLDPNADPDLDGLSNLLESIAGSDPLDPASAPRLSVATSGTNLLISLPGALGKRYELQSIQPPGPGPAPWTNWSAQSNFVLRAGNIVSFSSPASPVTTFFRVAIADVDSDGDGLNDWEEYKLGLDPAKPESNGQLSADGLTLNDYQFVAAALASQNVLSFSVPDPTANQPDPGQSPLNAGQLTVSRGGFPLNAITVNLGLAGPGPGFATEGLDFAPVPRTLYFPAGVSSQTINLNPLPNTNLVAPVVATLQLRPGPGYSLGAPHSGSITIFPSATPRGSGLTGLYYTNSSATYSSSANFNPANLRLSQVDSNINFTFSSTAPFTNSGYFSVRWTGQIQPQYSETYFLVANTDDGVKLWVNDQLIINSWVLRGATDSIGSIALQAGLKYNIKLEYFNGGGAGSAKLYWYSPSQAKQLIPAERLYPASAPAAPGGITSAAYAVAFVGQPFSFTVTAANSPSAFSASGLPSGLLFNPATGLITGTPNLAGDYQVMLTSSNVLGLSASVLELQVFDTGSSVVRDLWLGVPGTNIADIPLATTPTSTSTLGSLEGITGFGQNYAERIRGFFTAPATANYYFWIAASDSAELWISNDAEPCNKVRRAFVSPDSSTAPRQWSLHPNQRSGWLTLAAGQRYYLEILHKAGPNAGDNWSVGWLQDPTGTNFNPAGVVPGYLLSRYYPLPPAGLSGTLYSANLVAQANAISTGVGSATLRLSADGSQAVLRYTYENLSSPVTGQHIHCDAYLNSPSQIIFDIDEATPQPDGSYVWDLAPVGTLSSADIREIIAEGKAYINIHSVNYPAGEINGHFTLANGTQFFSPPPPPPAWNDDHTNPNAAARFLIQSTFGPSQADVAAVQSLGYEAWIDNQFNLPPTYHLPFIFDNISSDPTTLYPNSRVYNSWWQKSVTAPDQLRQRVAFALSEIMVVSVQGVLNNNARAVSDYYDTLLDHSFGNFRELLEAVTLSPAMGLYLDMRANDKGSILTGRHPNENYGREILQLFSIGLNRMWPDGSLVMDSHGSLVPTYNQNVIMGFASTFTGWNYYQTNQANGRLPTNFSPGSNYTNPMVLVPTHHELGPKLLLDNVVLPPAWGSQADSSSPDFDAYGLQDLERALDNICNNQNVGPFICRQLIQRLVTSHPSREYLYRVVQKFNDNGSGLRGDLKAVIKAILLDYEARSTAVAALPTFGKQREPLLRATATARAFPPAAPPAGLYSENGTRTITVSNTSPHRLNTGDVVFLNFTDSSGQPAPATQGYSVTVTSPSSFTVNAPAMLTGTYAQRPNTTISNMLSAQVVTTNIITVSLSGHGLLVGNPVYLNFTSGGASNGVYQVIWLTNNNYFAVLALDTNSLSGNVLAPKFTAGGYVQRANTVTVYCSTPHNLSPGDPLYINFTAGTAPDGTYSVATVPDLLHFTVTVANSVNQTQNGATFFPLLPPPLFRSGSVALQLGTFSVGNSDATLTQTPLASPTVFNFFFPDYQFPGALAAAGLTTPEFQLTSDTEVAVQMNFLEGGLLNNTGNTNGLSSFVGGGGALVLDLGPWMTPAFTSNAGIPSLVDTLNSLLTGGQLSPTAKNAIVAYVANTANFPFSTPSFTQMRDRVRAVVHLIVTSPDFTIQR